MGEDRPVDLNCGQVTEVHDQSGRVVAQIIPERRRGKLRLRVKPPSGGRVKFGTRPRPPRREK